MAAHRRTPRISRPKKIAALVGSGLGVAGVGLAAVLLSTSIGGYASIIDVPGTGSGPGGNGGGVSNEVSVDLDANAANGSNLDCSDIKVTADSTKLTFNPKLKKVAANGANASSQPVQGGSCTIFLDVKNTGDVPIKVNGDQTKLIPPTGWEVGPGTDNGLDKTIQPGATQTISSVLTATQAAQQGPVSGQLVYEDVPAAPAG